KDPGRQFRRQVNSAILGSPVRCVFVKHRNRGRRANFFLYLLVQAPAKTKIFSESAAVMSNGLTCGSSNASSPCSLPRRTISEFFQTPTSTFPLRSKQKQPKRAFSSTPFLRARALRILAARFSSNAIGHSPVAESAPSFGLYTSASYTATAAFAICC